MAAVFSVNQVHQLYVAKGYSHVMSEVEAQECRIGAIKTTGNCLNNKEVIFFYRGADGLLRSDRIQARNINYVKLIEPAKMRVPLKVVEVTLDSNINSGAPVAGQDYVLRINFRQFYGMSDEDQYIKDAVVHATTGMTASDFYKKMVKSLSLTFSREVGATNASNPYLEFGVYDSTSSSVKNAAAVIADLKKEVSSQTITATKIVITEKIQDYTRGLQSQERVYFDIIPTTIFTGSDDVIWGEATDATPPTIVEDADSESDTYQQMIPNSSLVAGTNAIGNGPKLADLEYFCMGERGDQYRMAGWPNYIPTKYFVDPTQEYYVVEIHYGFTDTGVNSYRSEKDITVISTNKAVATDFYTDFLKASGINDVETLKKDVADIQEGLDDNG